MRKIMREIKPLHIYPARDVKDRKEGKVYFPDNHVNSRLESAAQPVYYLLSRLRFY